MGRIFPVRVRKPGLLFFSTECQRFPKDPPEGGKGGEAESLSRGSAMYGLEVSQVRSTGARKRLWRGGALGQGRWGVPRTLACHPGSTQPGGTATDAGSHPTNC